MSLVLICFTKGRNSSVSWEVIVPAQVGKISHRSWPLAKILPCLIPSKPQGLNPQRMRVKNPQHRICLILSSRNTQARNIPTSLTCLWQRMEGVTLNLLILLRRSKAQVKRKILIPLRQIRVRVKVKRLICLRHSKVDVKLRLSIHSALNQLKPIAVLKLFKRSVPKAMIQTWEHLIRLEPNLQLPATTFSASVAPSLLRPHHTLRQKPTRTCSETGAVVPPPQLCSLIGFLHQLRLKKQMAQFRRAKQCRAIHSQISVI